MLPGNKSSRSRTRAALNFDVDRTRMLSSATGNADGPADSFPPDESRPSDQIVLPELFWDRAALAIGGAYRVRSFMILSARPHLGLTLCRDPGGSGTAPHQWPAFGIDDGERLNLCPGPNQSTHSNSRAPIP